VATNRNATIAVGGFACTVVYTGLARTLRSRGFLALGYVAGAATWTALTALLPLHSWRPVAAALLAVGYLGASELTWWPNEETQSPRTRVFGFAPTTALSLFFHAATVLVGALSFINSSPGYLSRGDYHHGVAVVGLTVLAVAYLIVAMRTTQRWSVIAVLLVAPLTAFVTGTWVVAAHAGVIVGVGAASVVALAVVKLGQSSVESSDAFAFVRWSPLLYVALGATAVRYPSWVGVVVLLTVTGVAMVTARLDEVTTTSARWAIATAELAAADALFFAVWRVLIATHHSSIECTASHLLAPAVVVSIVFLARAWWTRSRYEVVTVHPAYLPALVSLLVAVSSSLRGASAHHGYLAASVLTGYAIAVWYSAARLRLIWLVFGSAALLSGAQAVLLHVHGPIVWLPGLSVAASIFAATVFYVNRRMKDSTLHYVFWGLVLFVLAPLLRSEYRQYQVVGTVATAYAVLAVTVVYAALVWYAAHRLRYRWAVFAAGALLSGGVSTVITAYGSVQWLSPVAVGLIMAITTLYVAFVMRWLPLVLLAGALLTYAASIALRVEVGAAWAPLAAIVAAVLFFGARPLPSFTVAGVRWLPSWLDDAGRYALDSWRTALSTTQLLLLNGGLLWSGVLLHRDGYPGAIVTTVFIVVTTAPRLRLGRSRWTLLEYVLTPLSLSGVAPVLAVVLHQHNLQYFNLVPASTLLALSVTIIDRDLGPARVQVLEVARLTSALALVILFGTTLSQAFGGSGASSNLARLWFMVEAVVVLLVGVRTRTRVSALVGSAGVIASVLLTLSHSGNQIGGYLTAVALAIVLLFVALSQIAQRGEGSIGERTREVWAQWR